jgi:hypothetical protein
MVLSGRSPPATCACAIRSSPSVPTAFERHARLLWVPLALVALAGTAAAVTHRGPEPALDVPGSAAAPEPVAPPSAPVPGPEPRREPLSPGPVVASGAAPAAAAAAVPDEEPAPPPPPPAAPGGSEPVVNPPPERPDRVSSAPAGPPPEVSERSEAVYPGDFPDPYVLQANGSYWAFSTQVGFTAVPTLRSTDLVRWEWVGDALQNTPAWAEWGHHWAPAVLPRGSTFVLYYTTRHRQSGLQCISRAIGVLPQGPYVDRSDGPLVCQTARGGSIDPSPFVDADGRAWLLFKSEGTRLGEPTRLWVRRLSADGLRLVGEPVELLHRVLPWEFPIIENPAMVLVDGRHHLFYSGNRWETADYAVGHAVCDSVVGPCRRTSSVPVLTTRPGASGPGGQELVRLPHGEVVLVHHAWDPAAIGYPEGARMLHVRSLHFDGDHVRVGRPWRDGATPDLLGLGPSASAGSGPTGAGRVGRIGMPH